MCWSRCPHYTTRGRSCADATPGGTARVLYPLTITCGAKQVQTCLEPTTFGPQGRTLISIHLMLAAVELRRPTLTLAKLSVELFLLYKRVGDAPPQGVVRPRGLRYPHDLFPCANLCHHGWRGCKVRSLCGSGRFPTWHLLGPLNVIASTTKNHW